MKRIFALVVSMAALSAVCMAQLKNATDASIKQVASANEKITTIQCPFERTQKMEFMAEAAVSKGTFNYSKPSQLSMVYENGEIFVINESSVSVGNKGKVRSLKATNKHVEDLASTLLKCLKGDVASLDGTLKNTEKGAKHIVYTIDVDYKVGRSDVVSLELRYDKNAFTLVSIRLNEEDGSYTIYELQNKVLNKEIPASTYVVAKKKK